MPHLVSLGSVNADSEVRVDALPDGPGATLARDLLRTSGGKAGNVAVLAARLGVAARLVACVGDDDLAEQALRGPRSAGVDLGGVRTRPGPTGWSSIAVPPDGAKSIVLVPNANDRWGDDGPAHAVAEVAAAPEGSVLVADLEVPAAVVVAALTEARRRGGGVRSVLDPAPPERADDAVLALADHLTPDSGEATDLTGIDTDGDDGAGAARAAAELRGRSGAVVHVKLADGGCATATADGVALLHPPADLTVVDATGAGDAFAGALGWALLTGHGDLDAARLAVAASACAVGAYGSQESYPTLDALLAMAAGVEVTPSSPA